MFQKVKRDSIAFGTRGATESRYKCPCGNGLIHISDYQKVIKCDVCSKEWELHEVTPNGEVLTLRHAGSE